MAALGAALAPVAFESPSVFSPLGDYGEEGGEKVVAAAAWSQGRSQRLGEFHGLGQYGQGGLPGSEA